MFKEMLKCLCLGSAVAIALLANEPCTEWAKGRQYEAYLRMDRADQKGACTNEAMVALALDAANNPDVRDRTVRLLIGYLDYRLPEPKVRVSSNRDAFPALSAFVIIGKLAVPALVKAIAASSTSDSGRDVAVWSIFAICAKDPAEAVRTLRRASQSTKDWEESQRLLDSARKISGLCGGMMTNSCREALYDPEGK